jgi:ABC-type multidrug transport system fused ATPase/permease subunit
MKRLNLLYQIIEKRKLYFLFAIALMMVSVFIRTIEPKIIQVLIDDVLKKNLVTRDFFHLADRAVVKEFQQSFRLF